MSVRLLIRHGQATTNIMRLSSGSNRESALTETGVEQCKRLNEDLNIAHGAVALVSEYPRTHQTAELLGFSQIIIDPRLNETQQKGASSFRRLANLLNTGWLPADALAQAEDLITYPPPKDVQYFIGHAITHLALTRMSGLAVERPLKNCGFVSVDV